MAGPSELIIILAIVASLSIGVLPALWATIDAAMKPKSAWESSGQNQLAWVLIPIGAAFVCAPTGAIAAAVYLFFVRPKLAAGPPK